MISSQFDQGCASLKNNFWNKNSLSSFTFDDFINTPQFQLNDP